MNKQRVFFTSDSHFSHRNIIKYCNRPFSSIEEMDEGLIKAWNDTVTPNDIIYHLGDFCFMRPEQAKRLVERLNGVKYLIKGNHDSRDVIDAIKHKFVWIKDFAEISIDNQKIVLCHFPLMVWNKSHHGSWHLHGHCHGSLPVDLGSRRLDVGVDCHGLSPISFDRVKEIMAKRVFKPVDHHGE